MRKSILGAYLLICLFLSISVDQQKLTAQYQPFSERVSVASDGTEGNNDSLLPSISADGRFIAFRSHATNLVSDDTNNYLDIFVRDGITQQTTRVSIASDGTQSDDFSSYPSISSDGRFVVFESRARNLVSNDTNHTTDVFVHDRQTGETRRVSVASDGTEAKVGGHDPEISADGRWITFISNSINLVSLPISSANNLYLHDLLTGQTTRPFTIPDLYHGTYLSFYHSISADGRWIAFELYPINPVGDVFVYDRQTKKMTRVSVPYDGSGAVTGAHIPVISGDGQWVAFSSILNNLVPGDTNNKFDVFVAILPLAAPIRNYFTTSTPTLTWNRISWATNYEIEIDADPNFGTPGHYTRPVNGLSHKVDAPLDDGEWYWRVRAVGGTWSKPERFVVDAP